MKTITSYRAFGLHFSSTLALPEMRSGVGGTADVAIRHGTAPRPLGLEDIVADVAAGPRAFWMDVPDIARILVEDGQRMTVEPATGIDDAAIRPFLLGSAMGALLQQRGRFLLHASAVAVGGRAVAFVGTSGAGKSTFALHMAARGHPLLADDIAAITFERADSPLLLPGLTTLKASSEALRSVGLWQEGLVAVDGGSKYLLAVRGEEQPVPLAAVILLERAETMVNKCLAPPTAAATLMSQSYRGQLVHPMGRGPVHFEQCAQLAAAIAVHRLARPWSLNAADIACRRVEELMTS